MQSKKPLLFGVIGLTALGASLALAGVNSANGRSENDAASLSSAGISLSQAIAAAEAQTHGKAIRAEQEDENGTVVYGVEVINGAQATDVKVDISNGRILSTQADPTDHEADDQEEGERDDD